MNSPLAAVVCGMPFSGTTFLSRLICAHPAIDAGFECGLLFGKAPKNFPESGRFYEWMMDKKPPYNWKLTQGQMDEICAQPNFYDAYSLIVQYCHLFQDNEKRFVLDKTPAYVYQLKQTMRKVPETPFIVIQKEKLHQYYSFKKRDQSMTFFEERFVSSAQAISEAEALPGLSRRLLVLPFEEVVTYPAKTYRKIINFLERFNEKIRFEKSQVELLNKSLKEDMSGKKKLRKRFSMEDERNKLFQTLSDQEIKYVETLGS